MVVPVSVKEQIAAAAAAALEERGSRVWVVESPVGKQDSSSFSLETDGVLERADKLLNVFSFIAGVLNKKVKQYQSLKSSSSGFVRVRVRDVGLGFRFHARTYTAGSNQNTIQPQNQK